MRRTYQSESGQALVLIVLGIVGMLGFAALAIDGGRIYTDRRNMQNASDTSSLTGAGSFASYMTQNGIYWKNWSCSDTTSWFVSAKAQAYSDAINRAASNGYAVDADISDPDGANGITITCGSEPHTGFTDYYIDVTTYITADTPSSLAQFVFGGPLRQTVDSTARIRPQTAVGFGHAIVALNPADCNLEQNGVIFNGNVDVTLNGGGVFSNGCLRVDGSSGTIEVVDGTNTWISDLVLNPPSASVSPPPIQGDESIPDLQIPAPDCDHPSMFDRTASGTTLSPGRYQNEVVLAGNFDYVLQPGLYCFYDGVRFNTNQTVTGTVSGGVTLYILNGNFNVGGNATINLRAPLADDPGIPPAIPGLLIYLADGNTGTVNMQGTTGTNYTGTVYAPDGTINVAGTPGLNPTLTTQLIGWKVKIDGDSFINLNYDEALVYQFPPRLDLQE
jgi:hypothetical protein